MTQEINESRRDGIAPAHVPGVCVTRRSLMNKIVAVSAFASVLALPSVASEAVDPIFAAIAAHRKACVDFTQCAERDLSLADDDPAKESAEIANGESMDTMFNLARGLLKTRPTTLAGAVALLNHVNDGESLNFNDDWRFPDRALEEHGGDDEGESFHLAMTKHVAEALRSITPASGNSRPAAALPRASAGARPDRREGDPIFAKIEAHQRAYAAVRATDGTGMDDETFDPIGRREMDAAHELARTQPTTQAGLFALLAYLNVAIGQQGEINNTRNGGFESLFGGDCTIFATLAKAADVLSAEG
jgi:hypothetical protein